MISPLGKFFVSYGYGQRANEGIGKSRIEKSKKMKKSKKLKKRY